MSLTYLSASPSALVDPERVRLIRLGLSAVLVTALTAATVASLGVMQRFSISRVRAPELYQSSLALSLPAPQPKIEEIETKQVDRPGAGPSQPAAPTRQPASSAVAAESSSATASEDDDGPPDAVRPLVPGTPRGGGGVGLLGLSTQQTGHARCLPGMPCARENGPETGGGGLGGAPEKVRVERLDCQHCPSPSQSEIRRAGGSRLRSGTNVTALCVSAEGKAQQVNTKRSSGNREVDALIRQSVKRWRFVPFRVDGRARSVCTEVQITIDVR